MKLTVAQIQGAASDEEILQFVQGELNRAFPRELRRDLPVLLSRLQTTSKGLRAMVSTFELDVSLAMNDLAWHFINHPSQDWHEETSDGLRELEAEDAAKIYDNAFLIMQPFWDELATVSQFENTASKHDWLTAKGIEKSMKPLNEQMWNLLKQWPMEGLMHYWIIYARKYPERCIGAN